MSRACIQTNKHGTCQHKAWNGSGDKLCQKNGLDCYYLSTEVYFSDVPDDTVMYCGDIESAGEFHKKAEWTVLYGENAFKDFALENYDDEERPWHTAKIVIAKISLTEILADIDENQGMYDGWYDAVSSEADNDSSVKRGIERLREIFEKNPTYYEDQRVLFQPKGTPCIHFRGIEDCLCNNDPDDPGECIYENGIETENVQMKCKYYKGG